jgi:hypothetical protein
MKKLLISMSFLLAVAYTYAAFVPTAATYNIVQNSTILSVGVGAVATQPTLVTTSTIPSQTFQFIPVTGKADTYYLKNGVGNYLNSNTNGTDVVYQATTNTLYSEWVIVGDAANNISFMSNSSNLYLGSATTTLNCSSAAGSTESAFTLTPLATPFVPAVGSIYNIIAPSVGNRRVAALWNSTPSLFTPCLTSSSPLSSAFVFIPVTGKLNTYYLKNGEGNYLNSQINGWEARFEPTTNGLYSEWWIVGNDATNIQFLQMNTLKCLGIISGNNFLRSDIALGNTYTAYNLVVTSTPTPPQVNVTSSTNASTITNTLPDVDVSTGTILTIDANATFHSVTVEPGAKLSLGTTYTLTVNNLIIKADKTNVGSVSVTKSVLGGTVKLLKTLDNTKWYFMSFPCNVSVDAITKVSGSGTLGTIGTNWWIKYYDGAGRATNLGAQSNWKQITAGQTLSANQGYIIGLDNSLTGDYVLSFPLNNNLVTIAESAKTVTVGAYGEGTSTPANSVGWNLVGIPYLSKFAGGGVGAAYLTFYNGVTYTQSTNTGVSSVNPFDAFFIQASTTGTTPTTTNLAFTLASRQLVRSMVDVDSSERVQLNLTSETGTDNTNLIMDDTQSPAYEINRDLEKWLTTGTNVPQIYTQLDGINYAYNALPMTNVSNLPIGIYTKTAGVNTISANAAQALGLSKLLLTDNSTNPATVTDLLTSGYSFTSIAGIDNSRFVLTAQRISTANVVETDTDGPKLSIVNSQLSINNLSASTTVRVYDAIGRMVASKSINNNSIEIQLSAKGIYTIQIESGVKNWTKKFVNQ